MYSVVIVGAGQAGLAAAHALVRRGFTPGRDMLVLDGNDGPGGAWRHRWDSLTLGRAHGIADLPGMPMPRPGAGVPASELVAEYYGSYEDTFDLQVVRPARVIRVDGDGDGDGTGDGDTPGPLTVTVVADGTCTRLRTRMLISATGTWTHPYIPYIPGIDRFTGRQLHTVDYTRKEDFAGQRVLVAGGGLSAVQFLLELNEPGGAASTVWATRRPPGFVDRTFSNDDGAWGRDVERRVRADTERGRRPASVVHNTGIPALPEYLDAVAAGTLVSRGMFTRIDDSAVTFGGADPADGKELVQPGSWRPFPAGHREPVDVIFWNTGFRPALNHLSPLHLREPGGGITVANEVEVVRDRRVLLAGYGSTASTVGANRAGRLAGRVAAERLVE
ncbi:NAD(P)-binding domain-containing protein [Corynebacterium sp.]|uniref:NAD(P)-binding domain-containing protein n=1 Tax=Corynebacterium sp. TaxID=1720 RepID=UPI0028A637ED|nr:NAD(P)-binding domain-containing protein [Corynebacterium sp.]